MKPYYDDGRGIVIYNCDCRDLLPTLAPSSVQMCVTSPPYWGLRDYGHPNQTGLEATPEAFVANLKGIMAGVGRVLRDDGTLWLNLGDSYASQPAGNKTPCGFSQTRPSRISGNGDQETVRLQKREFGNGLKPKDLVGIPWRVAFALQADGWYLRSDIIWHKPNCMPESVTDRPTKSHEYLFLLAKSERYYYDAEAIAEPSVDPPGVSRGGALARFGRDEKLIAANAHRGNKIPVSNGKCNIRTVWNIATQPFPEAHFATFPEALVKPCVLAGSASGTIVLDPFAGAGTTLLVAKELGRRAIGIEIEERYCEIAAKRLAQEMLPLEPPEPVAEQFQLPGAVE